VLRQAGGVRNAGVFVRFVLIFRYKNDLKERYYTNSRVRRETDTHSVKHQRDRVRTRWSIQTRPDAQRNPKRQAERVRRRSEVLRTNNKEHHAMQGNGHPKGNKTALWPPCRSGGSRDPEHFPWGSVLLTAWRTTVGQDGKTPPGRVGQGSQLPLGAEHWTFRGPTKKGGGNSRFRPFISILQTRPSGPSDASSSQTGDGYIELG
jgi:hypothetical protein